MKKILLSTLVVLLLISAITVAFNFKPTSADPDLKYLTMSYLPTGMPAPTTSPAQGKIGLGAGWNGPIQAQDPVPTLDLSIRYRFNNWAKLNEESGVWDNSSTLNPGTLTLNQNMTVYACYVKQYTLRFDTGYVAYGAMPWIYNVSWYQTSMTWFDSGATAYVGISGLDGSDGINVDPGNQWAHFVNFTVPGVNPSIGGPQHQSNPITMTGALAVQANWEFWYYLYMLPHDTGQSGWQPVIPGVPPSPNPSLGPVGWYYQGTVVTLTAPVGPSSPPPPAGLGFRYVFDHWEVNPDVQNLPFGQSVNITMNTNKTARAIYKLELYLKVWDWPLNATGLYTHTGWYANCTQIPLTADDTVSSGAGIRYKFQGWWKAPGPGYVTTDHTITIHVKYNSGDYLPLEYQACISQLQYNVKLDTVPSGLCTVEIKGSDIVGPAPISGWFDQGTNVYFYVPDVAVTVPGDYMWQFDASAGKQWWLNGVPWGAGAVNDSWHYAGYPSLNQPINVTANYKKYYYIQWTTDPIGLSGPNPAWTSHWWAPAGGTFNWAYMYVPPYSWYDPVWTFKEIIDNGVSQGVGVSDYYLDGGTLSRAHNVVAHYVNATAFYITPGTTLLTAPKACTYNFNVTVTAANFDASRGLDLYAVDFRIYYNSTLIKVVADDYATYLNALWGPGNWFVAKHDSGIGGPGGAYDTYWFVATALKGATPMIGSKPVVKLTFHVELDPCYPTVYDSPITFEYYPQLTNSSAKLMTPELIYNAHYYISAPKPIVTIELTRMPIRLNVPQQTFDAYVNIYLGIKVKDFDIWITYPSGRIEPVNVTFGDYLPGPAFISRGFYFYKWLDKIHVWAEEDPAQAPHAYGNGTLFIIEFKVVNQVFWNNAPLDGMIEFDKDPIYMSHLSVCCPYPKLQTFNPDVEAHDAAYHYVPLPGDLNFDGYVDVCDLMLLASKYGLMGIPAGDKYDVNLDGNVNILDLVLVAMHWHEGTLP